MVDYGTKGGETRCPTLVLAGPNDVSTPPDVADALCHGIAGATLKITPDANHLSNIDQPRAFNTAVKQFAEGIANA